MDLTAPAWIDWEHLSTADLADGVPSGAVALLPVAAVEQHGPHLPLGTDAILTDAVVAAARARGSAAATVLRLPTQRVGLSPEHVAFPGTLSLDAETVIAGWTAIGASVARAGLRKLVILNGHGGQTGLVDVVATRLRVDHGMTVVRATTFRLLGDAVDLGARETRYGLHGGMLETSMMLAAAPDLVRRDALADFASAAEAWETRFAALEGEGDSGLGWMAQDLNPAGVTGDASAATAELGGRIIDAMASRLSAVIDDLARFEGFG
ncbi:MAG: creatininase family protein [Thalassobaculaceae bacterium]|nr:creatininase family protein [Thalassobaculaceae bacterium]